MHLLDKIKQLLLRSDYEGLIRMGAPLDEYDGIAIAIYDSLNKNDSICTISIKIWETFYQDFCTGTDSTGRPWCRGFEESLDYLGGPDRYKSTAQSIRAHMLGIF